MFRVDSEAREEDGLSERPNDARRFLERLLDGSLTFTPVETWKGRRYRIEDRANLGGLVRLPQTLIVASPGGMGTFLLGVGTHAEAAMAVVA
jgi:hypothetical protein